MSIPITNWPASERPRERLLAGGAKGLSELTPKTSSSRRRSKLLSKLALFLFIFVFSGPGSEAAPALADIQTYGELLHAIRETQAASQTRIEQAVEQEKVKEAWEIGKLIDEHILQHKERADYGDQVIIKLAKDLRTSETELKYMLQFARAYPIRPSTDELPWGHYRELLSLNDERQRTEVAAEASRNKWTQKELREEIKRRRITSSKDSPAELPKITPGPLYTYQIIRLKDRLKIDLGFGVYHGLPEKDSGGFKEGDIVAVDEKGNLKKTRDASLFTYSALVTGVVDGDTFHALIDLGFDTVLAQRVRLRRIDAPELLTADGQTARAYLEKILSRDSGRVLLQSRDLDQHGRPIADVWVKGKPVDQELLDQGLAVRMNE